MSISMSILIGMLIANSVPHLCHGLSGREFWTPFKRKVMSSAVVNAVWGNFNIGVAFIIQHFSGIEIETLWLFIGFAIFSIFLSFAMKRRNDELVS